jgi:predicted TIM-barrel fold metal-dependent hydrolase
LRYAGAAHAQPKAPRLPVKVNGKRVLTVDVHAHCYFREAINLMGDGADKVRPPVKGLPEHFIAIEQRLKEMDAMAIDMEVLSINPFWYGKDRDTAAQIVKVQNEKLAELCAARPERFAAFASLTLQYPDLAAQQLETAVKKQGLRGAAIGGNVLGEDFSDPKFHPVWAKAEELGAVLFIHPQSTPELAKRFKGNGWLSNTIGNPLDTTIALQHLIFEGTLDRFPGIKIIAAHGGGYLGSYAARRPCMLRVTGKLQSEHHAEEKAVRISQPALFRRHGVHTGRPAPSGGAGRRQPGVAGHRPPDPLGAAPSRSCLRDHDAFGQTEDRDPGRECGEAIWDEVGLDRDGLKSNREPHIKSRKQPHAK